MKKIILSTISIVTMLNIVVIADEYILTPDGSYVRN